MKCFRPLQSHIYKLKIVYDEILRVEEIIRKVKLKQIMFIKTSLFQDFPGYVPKIGI